MDLAARCGKNLLIDDRTHHTTQSIWQVVSSKRPDLVIIDIAKGLKDKAENQIERLGLISMGGRDIARDLNCHVMFLHHLKRATQGQENKVPDLSDLSDSSELEKNADLVFFLHSPDYYGDTALPTTVMTDFIIGKNREGPRKVAVHLAYKTKAQWFVSAKEV
jgi:replicative DNA helicase